jgi:hypothetical protein
MIHKKVLTIAFSNSMMLFIWLGLQFILNPYSLRTYSWRSKENVDRKMRKRWRKEWGWNSQREKESKERETYN